MSDKNTKNGNGKQSVPPKAAKKGNQGKPATNNKSMGKNTQESAI